MSECGRIWWTWPCSPGLLAGRAGPDQQFGIYSNATNRSFPDVTQLLASPACRARRAAAHTSRSYPRVGKRTGPSLKPSQWRGACSRGRHRLGCRPSTSSAGAPSPPPPPPPPVPRRLARPLKPSAASPRSWVTSSLLRSFEFRPVPLTISVVGVL